jgi:hypothetical protein
MHCMMGSVSCCECRYAATTCPIKERMDESKGDQSGHRPRPPSYLRQRLLPAGPSGHPRATSLPLRLHAVWTGSLWTAPRSGSSTTHRWHGQIKFVDSLGVRGNKSMGRFLHACDVLQICRCARRRRADRRNWLLAL